MTRSWKRLWSAMNLGGLTSDEAAVRTGKRINDDAILTPAAAITFYAFAARALHGPVHGPDAEQAWAWINARPPAPDAPKSPSPSPAFCRLSPRRSSRRATASLTRCPVSGGLHPVRPGRPLWL